MPDQVPEQKVPFVTPARIIAAVCVLVPFIAVLCVPIYDRTTPEAAGFPFFFWWQLLWVVITAGLMALAYYVVRREELARKAVGAGAGAGAGAGTGTGTGTGNASGTAGGTATDEGAGE